MTQAIGPITMVSFFNGFIDFICFKSLHPTVNNSFEQNKCYSTFIIEWWICNLAGVVWLRSIRTHKNWEGFFEAGNVYTWSSLNLPQNRLKTLWTWSFMELFCVQAGRPKQLVKSTWEMRATLRRCTSLHFISKERAVAGAVTLGFLSVVTLKRSHLHLLYSLR